MNLLPSLLCAFVAGVFALGLCIPSAHAATFTVSNLNDSGAGSLREVLALANANGAANEITFASSVKGTLRLTQGGLTISSNVSIVGPGTNVLTVSGEGKGRVFTIFSGTVALSNLTLANGLVVGGTGQSVSCRAVLNNGNLTLTQCLLRANKVQGGPGRDGGVVMGDRVGWREEELSSALAG